MSYNQLFPVSQFGTIIAIKKGGMLKSKKNEFIRYEFVTNISAIVNKSSYKVSDILLTEDDLSDIPLQSNEINWISVSEVNVIDVGEIGNESSSESGNSISGLFNAEPRNWKYARMVISDHKNNKNLYAVGKMPRSPIIPIIFALQKI